MATYYVIGAGGSDSNDGSNDTTQGWATIDKAMNTVAAGDLVYVKATGTYDEQATIDTAGSASSPGGTIVFEGYTTTPGDNGLVSWTKSTSGNCLVDGVAAAYYMFKNMDFNNSVGIAVNLSCSEITFYNCKFRNSGSHGLTNGSNNQTCINCEFTNNTNEGVSSAGNYNRYLGCIFGNNNRSLNGSSDTGMIVYKCVFYGDGYSAYALGLSACDYGAVLACTFDGENTQADAIQANLTAYLTVVDNIFHDFTQSAMEVDDTEIFAGGFVGYNVHSSAGTYKYFDGVDEVSDPCFGLGDVNTADVAFTDEANDDYTLGATSPAIDAGITPGGIT